MNVNHFILKILKEIREENFIIKEVLMYKKGKKINLPHTLYQEFIKYIDHQKWFYKTPKQIYEEHYLYGNFVKEKDVSNSI